jgi:hypothetical protein
VGKNAVENVTMLKEAFKDKAVVQHKCTCGSVVSKEVKCLLKTNCVVAVLPRAELTKMLKKFTRPFLQFYLNVLKRLRKSLR